jgi:hypothetical protein
VSYCEADTISYSSLRIVGNVSTSLTHHKNWGALDHSSLTFGGAMNVWRVRDRSDLSTFHAFTMELGVTHLLDSLWLKSSDRVRVNLQFRKSRKKKITNYSVLFCTQLFDGYALNKRGPQVIKVQTESFLFPFKLEAGYGIAWNFWNRSTMNVSLATIRSRGFRKLFDSSSFEDEDKILKTKNGYIVMDYGMSGQWYIFKDIHESLEWTSQGNFFVNGINRNEIGGDLSNKLTFTIWKYFKLMLDSRILYDSYRSYRLQIKNEILFGFFYDSKIKK